MVREIDWILPSFEKIIYNEELTLFKRVLVQKKNDKNKIYSPHKSCTDCMPKAKPTSRMNLAIRSDI